VVNTLLVDLPTGTLDLVANGDVNILEYCDFAARANPKRGFLIVSKVLGRHLPARPAAMRGAMDALGAMLPGDLPGSVVFIGMAETATALGQGVFAAYRKANPGKDVIYLQSSRQIVRGAELIASFEEGHSHATTHLVQVADPALVTAVRAARTLVIVDDECSTGGTYLAVAQAMVGVMPQFERIAACCITDWSGGGYIPRMPLPTTAVSILSGAMTWTPAHITHPPVLAAGSNVPGHAPVTGMNSRSGLRAPEAATRAAVGVRPGERVLVLGEGEHSYEALCVAEEIERAGGIAAVQCITRSPALPGAAMQSVSTFRDSYGSGAPCFLYNILGHRPDRIVIVAEVAADQVHDAEAALGALGSDVPVDLLLCTYPSGTTL
jgi:hypothetical protein